MGKKIDVDSIFGAINVGQDEMTARQSRPSHSQESKPESAPRRGRPKSENPKEPLFVRVSKELLLELDQEFVKRRAAEGRGAVCLQTVVEDLLWRGLGKTPHS